MRLLFSLFLVLLLFPVIGQVSNDFSKLDDYFDLLENNNKFMGGVAIYEGDDLLYERYCGYADIDKSQKIDSLTMFRIGSISKMFTSVLLFREIEKGKLSLDTHLDQFFPEIKNAEKITIGQLLSHRSGIHNFTNDLDYLGYMTYEKSREDLLQIIQSKGSDFEPGEKMQYSNSNFVLLTFILEDLSGESYNTLVDNLCVELGLKHTKVGGKINTSDNEAQSYKFVEKWQPESETDMSIPLGAGAIISTPRDLNLFIQKLFNGKVLSEESFKAMTTIKDGVGYGIFSFPFHDKTLLGHNGGIDGFRSNLSINKNISQAVTGNGFNYNLNDILIACLSEMFDRDYELPDFSAKKVELEEGVLKSLEGTYSSSQMPLKIWIAFSDGKLTAQATGQSPFPLTAYESGVFKFDPAGIQITFPLEKDQIVSGKFQLKQNGMTFEYQRE
nr:serine hydrolase domain-containing protein [uncultured Carboxylicivirga sp.]